MVRDADAHAEEDRQRREEADARNRADTLVYSTEKLLADQGDKVDAADKAAVESALAELKEALQGADAERMNTATEALNVVTQKMSQSLYEQAAQTDAAGGAGEGAAEEGAADDEVVDAEIIEDDDSDSESDGQQ